MAFGASDYKMAAEEHITAAGELYRQERFVLAHYVAGLAVECMFRAYRRRIDSVFDSRHDLYELAKASRFFDVVPENRARAIRAALGVVYGQWQNDHRYRSEDALRRFLVEKKLYLRIKGDLVKENTRRVVNAALDLVTLGGSQWEKPKS